MPGWTGLANARVTMFGDVYQLADDLQAGAREVGHPPRLTAELHRMSAPFISLLARDALTAGTAFQSERNRGENIWRYRHSLSRNTGRDRVQGYRVHLTGWDRVQKCISLWRG